MSVARLLSERLHVVLMVIADTARELLELSTKESLSVHGLHSIDIDVQCLENGAAHRQRPQINCALLAIVVTAEVPAAAVFLEGLNVDLTLVDLSSAGEDGLITPHRIAASANRYGDAGVAELWSAGSDRAAVLAMSRC